MQKLNWNQLAELGLLERINKEILHPPGLAMYRTPEDGNSGGALVADDGFWEYPPNKIFKNLTDEQIRIVVPMLLSGKSEQASAEIAAFVKINNATSETGTKHDR